MKTIELQDKDLTIPSTNWKKSKWIINTDEWEEKISIKTNPQWDVWEIDEWKYKGCQYFTYNAMVRETTKRGLKVPDNEYWEQKIKEGWKPEFAGYRYWDNGQYYSHGTNGYYWSSSPSTTDSYVAYLYSGGGGIASTGVRGFGFSVRCLKNEEKENTETPIQAEREASDSSTLWLFGEVIERLQDIRTSKEFEVKKINEAIDLLSNIK